MRKNTAEGCAIARLYGRDPDTVIGWIFLWGDRELWFMLEDPTVTIAYIEPQLDPSDFDMRLARNRRVMTKLKNIPQRPKSA